MADYNDIGSLISGLVQQHQSESLYPLFAKGIESVNIPMGPGKVDSPWGYMAANLAKGLLSGGLQAYGVYDNNQFKNSAMQAIPMLAHGQDISGLDGLGSSDASSIKNAFNVLSTSRDLEQQQLIDSQRNSLIGQAEGKKAVMDMGLGGGLNPDQAFKEQEREAGLLHYSQDLLTQKDPTAASFQQMAPALDTMQRLVGTKDAATDSVFKLAAARIADSIGAIGSGASANIDTAIPQLDKWLGGFTQFEDNGGVLTPEGKMRIIQAFNQRVAPMGERYQAIVDSQRNALKAQGGNPDLLTVAPYVPFDAAALAQKYGLAAPVAPIVTPAPDMQAQFKKYRQEGKSVDEIRLLMGGK